MTNEELAEFEAHLQKVLKADMEEIVKAEKAKADEYFKTPRTLEEAMNFRTELHALT